MPSHAVLLALGVPAGLLTMPDHRQEGQVWYGREVWHLTPAEYAQWHAVRLQPCALDTAPAIAHDLLRHGALYPYDPAQPDHAFMAQHRIAPMGCPIGPSDDSADSYRIISTNGRHTWQCSATQGHIWLHWWHYRPLSSHPVTVSDETVWETIPWAISHQLGYLVPWEDLL